MAQDVITRFRADTKDLTSKVDKATGKVKKNVKEAQASTNKLSKAFKGLGAAITAGLALQQVSRAFRFVINTTKEFEAQMARVSAISGATGNQFKKLSEDAKRLGASTKFTATEVSQLQEAYAKLGFSTAEILNASEATLQLATATGEGLAQSAEVAGSTLRAFGLDAEETGRVVDVMAASFTSSALDLESFRESMKLVAPIARAANIPIETTTALLGSLADAGLKGSIAGTSLKNLLSKLSDENSDLAKQIGFSVKNSDDLFRAFEKLKQGNIDLTKATELTDERSKAAFITLLNGVDSVEALTEALNGAEGAAKTMADTVQNTLQGDIDSMNSAIEGLSISLGSGEGGLSDMLRRVTQSFTTFIRNITTANIASENFGQFLAGVAGSILAVFSDDAMNAAQALNRLNNIAKKIPESGKEVAAASTGMAAALGGYHEGLKKTNSGTEETALTIEELKNKIAKLKTEMLNQALAGKISTASLSEFKEITKQLTDAQNKLKKALAKPKGTDISKELIPDEEIEESLVTMGDRMDWIFEGIVGSIEETGDAATKLSGQMADEGVKAAEDIRKAWKQLGEDQQAQMALALQATMEIGGQLFGFIQANREADLINLEKQKEAELEIAGDNEQAREAIEEKFAKKQKELKKQQAEDNKAAAIFDIVLSTATGIQAALGSIPPNPPLAAIIAATGAVNLATVIARPIPQFAEGTPFVKLNGNPKGRDTVPAMLDEGERVISAKNNKKNWHLYNAIERGELEKYIMQNYVLPQINPSEVLGKSFAENVGRSIKINNKFHDRNIVERLDRINTNLSGQKPARFNPRKI